MPNYDEIDVEKLRDDLIDYFGTAMTTGYGAAMVDIQKIEKASDEEVIRIAIENRIDLSNYRKSITKSRF